MEKEKIYRTIDANLNRAAEGLRVVEDGLRFAADDAAVTAKLRALRHELRRGASLLPGGDAMLLAARNSAGDVARNAPPRTNGKPEELVLSNFKRAQEAVRSLEEFSKLLSPQAASHFGELRFRIYDLEKEISEKSAGAEKKQMPAAPFLYIVADYATLSSGGTFAFLRAVLRAGCGIVQLREKNRPDLEIVAMGKQVAGKMKKSGALFFINDRADIALAAGADGVHLGTDDLPLATARDMARGKLLFGLSTHTMKQAVDAAAQAPDYIAVGPVFQSPTKTERAPVGVELLKKVCAKTKLPVVAIGGISAGNAAQIAAAGASGAAVISAITRAKNPGAEASIILNALKNFHNPSQGKMP